LLVWQATSLMHSCIVTGVYSTTIVHIGDMMVCILLLEQLLLAINNMAPADLTQHNNSY
jgi:hypothetical protein